MPLTGARREKAAVESQPPPFLEKLVIDPVIWPILTIAQGSGANLTDDAGRHIGKREFFMNIGMTALRNGGTVLRTRKYTGKDEAEASGFAAELERTAAWRDTASVSASKPVSAPEPADPNAILPTDSVQVKLEKLQKIAETADYTGMSYEEIYCAIWDRYQQAFDGKMPILTSGFVGGNERCYITNQFAKEIDKAVRYPLYREIQAETSLRYGEKAFSQYWDEHYRGKFEATVLGYGGMAPEEIEQAILEKYAGKNTLSDFVTMMGELSKTGVLAHKMGGWANVAECRDMISLELEYKCFPNLYDRCPTDEDWAGIMYQPFDARGFVQGVKKAVQTQYHFENWDFDIRGMLDSAIDDLLSMLDKSVESAHAAVERAVQAGLEQSGYMKFGDRMIPLNIM